MIDAHVVVISCWNYRDAWRPFFELFQKFWPECPYDRTLITDAPEGAILAQFPIGWATSAYPTCTSWCEVLSAFAFNIDRGDRLPILLFQEDFFLTAPVRQELVEHGLQQMAERDAACVRLYPCPGSDADYGDPYFGIVNRGTPYRTSCQAAFWRPRHLYEIAKWFQTPSEFETSGTTLSEDLPSDVLAFKRDMQPWPMEYLCSAISRGKWNPDAKRLCDTLGIEVDWSARPFDGVLCV